MRSAIPWHSPSCPGRSRPALTRCGYTAAADRTAGTVFASRLSGLSAAVRALLLVAALDDGGDQERIIAAASMLRERGGQAVGAAELADAQAAGAVTIDGDGLRFRHPLMRSAVYQRSLVPERRAAHNALASVYSSDPDRGVWHQAASVAGPDDRISAELEAMADRAARRGAAGAAVAALARAARLTTQDSRRGRLLLRAAWLAYEAGDLDVSGGLVRDAQRLPLRAREQTLLRCLLEFRQETAWPGTANIGTLVEIAGQLHAIGETDQRWTPWRSPPSAAGGGILIRRHGIWSWQRRSACPSGQQPEAARRPRPG